MLFYIPDSHSVTSVCRELLYLEGNYEWWQEARKCRKMHSILKFLLVTGRGAVVFSTDGVVTYLFHDHLSIMQEALVLRRNPFRSSL